METVIEAADAFVGLAVAGERIGEFVARQRQLRGLSQMALAERSGVGYSSLAQLEQGRRRRPTQETMRALAAGLGMSYVEFLIGVGELRPSDVDVDLAAASQAVPEKLQAMLREMSVDEVEMVEVFASTLVKSKRSRAD